MRIMTVILLLCVLVLPALAQRPGTLPRACNANWIQYSMPWLDWEVYNSNAGLGGYREAALGADTLFVGFDLSSATYDHGEVYIEFKADNHLGNPAVADARPVAIYWLQSIVYSARTATAGHKLSLVDMNSEGGITEYAYRTFTPDSASYANKVMIDNLSGLLGQSTGVIGPFWVDANAAADSTMSGFVVITADTVGVSWRALLVPRT